VKTFGKMDYKRANSPIAKSRETSKRPLSPCMADEDARLGRPHHPVPLLIRAARIAGWAGIAAITVLSLVPGSERPHTNLPGMAEHFVAYACTGFALSLAYQGLRERLIFWAALGTASGVFEILQMWIPGRSCEIEDVVVSTLGVTTGLLLGAALASQLSPELPVDNPEKQRQR
jgi:hypothetical protein